MSIPRHRVPIILSFTLLTSALPDRDSAGATLVLVAINFIKPPSNPFTAPNVMAPFLIMLSTFVGHAILLEASLSYLGLGVQEPTPAWGLMLQGGAEEYAESAPWMAIWPGVAISLAVFGFNLFGDALRDALDPKLRQQ